MWEIASTSVRIGMIGPSLVPTFGNALIQPPSRDAKAAGLRLVAVGAKTALAREIFVMPTPVGRFRLEAALPTEPPGRSCCLPIIPA